MKQNRFLITLRGATTGIAVALCSLGAACQDWIDLAATPLLCNQTHTFTLKETLPDGYVYLYGNDGTEIVLTRDKDTVNRYTSTFPQSPYIMSCDYLVKDLGGTVTMIACLAQYQQENPYYVLFAADSPEQHSRQWQDRVNEVGRHSEWIVTTPIDIDFLYEVDFDQLQQMRSRLEQADQTNDLIKFNLNQLNILIASSEDVGDCEAK